MNPHALDIAGLIKHHPRFTLGPVNLTVPKGSIYGLIGPNGAGKTTLLDQIFGMAQQDAGSIQVAGWDNVRHEVAVKENTAYASPEMSYAAWGRVGAAIRFIRSFHAGWDDAYASQLLQAFGLSLKDRIATLSFGNRMKLNLLLAMAWKPKVLVLDEPTTGLDAHSKKTVFTELLAIVRDEERSILLSSHQIADVERFADQVGILHQGRLLTSGTPSELVTNYRQVEFQCEDANIARTPGLVVQEQQAGRWLAVLNTEVTALAALTAAGAEDLRAQPLTLEDLFLALTR